MARRPDRERPRTAHPKSAGATGAAGDGRDPGPIDRLRSPLSGNPKADDLARFEKAIAAVPQVVEVSHVTGAYDYLLKVVVANMPAWTRIAEQLTSADLGVERINTHVLMHKPKVFTGYPVPIR